VPNALAEERVDEGEAIKTMVASLSPFECLTVLLILEGRTTRWAADRLGVPRREVVHTVGKALTALGSPHGPSIMKDPRSRRSIPV
jgi:hypothetical protein